MSVLDDIKNGTNKPGTAQQSSSGLNSPANPPESSAQPKETQSETVNDGDQVPFAQQNITKPGDTTAVVPTNQTSAQSVSSEGEFEGSQAPFAERNVSHGGNEESPTPEPVVIKPRKYEDMYRELNPDPIPNEEDLKKEHKRERAKALVAALGDGISAISNLYSTTKGAVPVPTTPTLSERNAARYNEIVNRRLKKADDRKQALTNSMFMDKQQDYREGRDKVEDQHYEDGIDYRDRQEKIALAQKLAEMEYKNANLDFNAKKFGIDQEEKVRHNKALESIGTSKLGLEGERVAIAGRNEQRLEDAYGAGGSKRSKVRVVNTEGKLVNVDADIMSQADYWNYAKNALVQDGLLPNRAKVEDAKKFLSNRAAYEKSPKLRELREKVGSRLFQQQPAPVNKTQKPDQPAKAQHSNAKKTAQPAKNGSLLPH